MMGLGSADISLGNLKTFNDILLHVQIKLLCVRIKATHNSKNKFLNHKNELAAEKVKTKKPQWSLYLLEDEIVLHSGEERKRSWPVLSNRVQYRVLQDTPEKPQLVKAIEE